MAETVTNCRRLAVFGAIAPMVIMDFAIIGGVALRRYCGGR
jgi:hypothetical protein